MLISVSSVRQFVRRSMRTPGGHSHMLWVRGRAARQGGLFKNMCSLRVYFSRVLHICVLSGYEIQGIFTTYVLSGYTFHVFYLSVFSQGMKFRHFLCSLRVRVRSSGRHDPVNLDTYCPTPGYLILFYLRYVYKHANLERVTLFSP